MELASNPSSLLENKAQINIVTNFFVDSDILIQTFLA